MSVLASKVIAINIVDIQQDGFRTVPDVQLADGDNRIAQLENQMRELKQLLPQTVPQTVAPLKTVYSSSEESASTPDSPNSLQSLDSSDLPTIEGPTTSLSGQTDAKKSNLPKHKAKPDTDTTNRILSIIQSYGQNEDNADGDAWLGRVKFEARVRKHVEANIAVDLVLPAFPWKSVNKVEKVVGAVADLGEVLGLGRLQALCEDIQAIYEPGAYVTVTSDGLVYNDLLGISDEEVYEYGGSLRRMAKAHNYDRLRFIRIMNLLGLTDEEYMSKEDYLNYIGPSRIELVEKYLPEGFDCREAIMTDEDINLTYCGYMLFLNKDLRHSPITAGINTKNEYKRVVKRVAQDMIMRGKAFAALIDAKLPDYVRLSIHRSTGLNKLSFPLVPQPNHFSMTPWHCSITVTSKGEFRTSHASEMRKSADLIEEKGQPFYFRDRSPVWKWDVPVEFEFFYPKGVFVKANPAKGEAAPKLGPNEMKKLKELGKGFTTVIPLGFS